MLRGAPQFLHFISEIMSDSISFLDCSRIELMKAELRSLTQGWRIGGTRRSQEDDGLHNNSSLCHISRSPLRRIRFLPRPCNWTVARSSRSFPHNTAPILDWSSDCQTHEPSPLSCSW